MGGADANALVSREAAGAAAAGAVAVAVAVVAGVCTTNGTRYVSCAQSGSGTEYDHSGPSYLYACNQIAGSKFGSCNTVSAHTIHHMQMCVNRINHSEAVAMRREKDQTYRM